MDYYILDDSVDHIEWGDIEKVNHLDPDNTYKKLLLEIDDCLDPKKNLYLNFDYESIKLLLQQAQEFDIPFISSDTLIALFISKCTDIEVRQKLFKELRFGEARKTAMILDPHLYKRICSTLQDSMDIKDIQEFRKLLLEELVIDKDFPNHLKQNVDYYIVDVNYSFDERSNERTPEERLNLFFLDLIAEYFFDDYYENVCIDIHQMLKYIELTKNQDIPSDRLSFYEEFYKLRNHSMREQQDFFRNHKNFTIMDSFYDDMRLLKDASYKSLIDACTKFTPNSPLYNKDMSEIYGCDIYYLNGEEFYGFVRSDVNIKKKYISKDLKVTNTEIPTGDKIKRLGHSFTYIGKDDIQTFQNPNSVLTMLYTGIDYQTIGHVYHNDSWTNPDYYYYSDYQNELHTPESLLKESTKYPEILITDLQKIEPCALVCLDEPSDWDVEFSQKNKLPIVVINSKKYERKYAQENYFDEHYTR